MSNIEVVDILKQQACHCSNKFFSYMLLKAGLGNYVLAQLFLYLHVVPLFWSMITYMYSRVEQNLNG